MQAVHKATGTGLRQTTVYKLYMQWRASFLANILFSALVPLIALLTCEWIARGTLGATEKYAGFWSTLAGHFNSFLIAYMLLLAIYVFVLALSSTHAAAALVVGLLANVPATVTYYKLTLRGEPFLPWDITQVGDLMAVSGSMSFDIPANIILTLLLFFLLAGLGAFLRLPRENGGKPRVVVRLFASGLAAVAGCILLFGVFLSPTGTLAVGIKADAWMQDRYYRTHGVITGFLTNLQMLDIQKPEGYSEDAVRLIAKATEEVAETRGPYYEGSYAAVTGSEDIEQHPNIIYIMAESFWDVTLLEGITYDQEILPNLTRLKQEGAYGTVYSPSFGGGTCDVEFEALTGFSMEHLPAGSKPYQQYCTEDLFSIAQHLKGAGYDTLAIHGYGGKFWNRDKAYPNLGIDEFIDNSQFKDPIIRRGFISDDSMIDRVIEEFKNHSGSPVFIHAVTMQNHTTYSRDRYPEGELVQVISAPDTLEDSIIGQLEDCATGMREMDAALGKLCQYLASIDEPTIVVFWGDHMNPMSDGHSLFEETGYIEKGDTGSPELMKTPLLVWSNYSDKQVDLGTLASYNISPVTMDLYGLDMPVMFEYLVQQLGTLRARTKGITVQPSGDTTEEMTEAQMQAVENHAVLQYDFMFGNCLLYGEDDGG